MCVKTSIYLDTVLTNVPKNVVLLLFFCHNKTLFYTQGSFDELFHIVKATHNPEEAIESNKMFDVC